MSLEGGADLAGIFSVAEVERREEGPDAAPAVGEDAGPRGGAGAEIADDEYQDVVGKRAEAVLATGAGGGVRGELGTLGGDLTVAAAVAAAAAGPHGAERWGLDLLGGDLTVAVAAAAAGPHGAERWGSD